MVGVVVVYKSYFVRPMIFPVQSLQRDDERAFVRLERQRRRDFTTSHGQDVFPTVPLTVNVYDEYHIRVEVIFGFVRYPQRAGNDDLKLYVRYRFISLHHLIFLCYMDGNL